MKDITLVDVQFAKALANMQCKLSYILKYEVS